MSRGRADSESGWSWIPGQYFAAEFLVDSAAHGGTEWEKFADFVRGQPDNLRMCLGFADAVAETADLALAGGEAFPEGFRALLESLRMDRVASS